MIVWVEQRMMDKKCEEQRINGKKYKVQRKDDIKT